MRVKEKNNEKRLGYKKKEQEKKISKNEKEY